MKILWIKRVADGSLFYISSPVPTCHDEFVIESRAFYAACMLASGPTFKTLKIVAGDELPTWQMFVNFEGGQTLNYDKAWLREQTDAVLLSLMKFQKKASGD